MIAYSKVKYAVFIVFMCIGAHNAEAQTRSNIPSRIGGWSILNSENGEIMARTKFEAIDDGRKRTLSHMNVFCREGKIAYQLVGNLGARRAMRATDFGEGNKPIAVFRFDKDGIFDQKSSSAMTKEMRMVEAGYVGKRAAGTPLFMTIDNHPESFPMSSDEEFNIDGARKMLEFMSGACSKKQ